MHGDITSAGTHVSSRELAFAGIVGQAALMRDRQVSSVDIVRACLERIERLNPSLNAFRTVFADEALAAAGEADLRRRCGDDLPLLGVPIAIKDDTEIAGVVATHGSRAFDRPSPEDSAVVDRLRRAGAIPIGQTNVPELEIWPFTASHAHGATRNPWDLTRTPGGSSGGSAAAVAAGLVGAATGSDGMGSIRIPAACCGLVGIKPQRGRVSMAPAGDAWHGLSVRGPLARRVTDAALLLDILGGSVGTGQFAAAAGAAPGRLRVAISRRVPPGVFASIDADVSAGVDGASEALRALGHAVQEREPPYGTTLIEATVRYIRGVSDGARAVGRPEMLERRTRRFIRLGRLLPDCALERARARERRAVARMAAFFEDFDVLVTPITARTAIDADPHPGRGALATLEASGRFVPFTGVWNALGHPAMAVPIATSSGGLPVGIQLVGRPDGEATLISLAAQLEAELRWHERYPAGS
jgi:amidase